jgi:hypothetical protein
MPGQVKKLRLYIDNGFLEPDITIRRNVRCAPSLLARRTICSWVLGKGAMPVDFTILEFTDVFAPIQIVQSALGLPLKPLDLLTITSIRDGAVAN